jgi:predicted amidohydrolase
MKDFQRIAWMIVAGLLLHTHGYSQKSEPFTLALAQMRVVGGDLDTNLAHAAEMISEAAEHGAQVVLLPEAMDLGWTDPSALTEAEPVPGGKASTVLSNMARLHGIYVCSGLTEKAGEKVYNTAVLINPRGEIILHHRKINELDIGHPYYALGQRLSVIQTELGTIGVMICADASTGDHVIPRTLSYMGADVILSPSAWAVPADHHNYEDPYGETWINAYKPVARDFRVWIAACSNVGWMTGGPWKGWKTIGCSMVIGPGGTEVLHAPYGNNADTILYVDILPEPRPGQGTTWHKYWEKLESAPEF